MKDILFSFTRAAVVGGLAMALATGCSSFVSGASKSMAEQLLSTISNHDDPDLVKDAAPAYMLMLESFLLSKPDDVTLLSTAGNLYNAYASTFVTDPERQQRLAERALDYSKRAVCAADKDYCDMMQLRLPEFTQVMAKVKEKDVPVFFALGGAWAGWIRANSGDFSAIADIPKIRVIMQRIVELDEGYQNGGAHLYLGVLETLIPPTLGGKPEVGRSHFERAISLSQGKNLLVKVTYAQQYARLLFDRPLHDKLLQEVMAADPKQPGFTLTNSMAQQQAQQLLDTADDYF